ncbi:MAG: hypothetical protein ABW168_22855 [Sedimenticola sp.]
MSFIKQVGGALEYLEKINAYHGDLHEDNIIVSLNDAKQITFKVIDVSYGVIGSASAKICHDNDVFLFQQHINRILRIQHSYLSKMSIKKYLGAKLYFLISSIMKDTEFSFTDLILLMKSNSEYMKYVGKKKAFISSNFSAPGPFKLLRFEEITDHVVARELFHPFPDLMNAIKEFSNAFVSGNRGSGKSTYLAALAFFPKVSQPIVSHIDIFGIYFPCRQGEFRLFSNSMINYKNVSYQDVKNVFIIKVVRRTLEILAEALEVNRLSVPDSYANLRNSLKRFVKDEDILSLDRGVVSEIDNVLSILIRIEMKALDDLFKLDNCQPGSELVSERDLIEFFRVIRMSFRELENTQFYILFDDAGAPNMPQEAQKIINDLILSSNPLYCIKFSAERYTYNFSTTDGKNLESGHDYNDYDISSVLFIGNSANKGVSQHELSDYFERIVQKRLAHFEYQSYDIKDYVGYDSVKYEYLINSLSNKRRNAKYSGWPMIWMIADRTPRSLLEIVSEIFSAANVDKNSSPDTISDTIQNRAIRYVSEKRLRSLNQISGSIEICKQKMSVGRIIYDITRSLGSVYKFYLSQEKGKERKRQYLAIERNDSYTLSADAETILRHLVTYGIFDESRSEYARDDGVKKPLYVLNRIFCPSFSIAMHRDNHLKLSKGKFEQLLLDPVDFVKGGTKMLQKLNADEPILDLFGDV